VGIRYHDRILLLAEYFRDAPATLEEMFAHGRTLALDFRGRVRELIESNRVHLYTPVAEAQLHTPFVVRSFVDFYSSREHAENVGRRFRDPAHPLPENWLHLPSAYNGRASNVQAAGLPVHRPQGQRKLPDGAVVFGPTQELDFELEIGYFLCPAAPDQLAGFVLLNDWSARDIQRWEYVPLGPFLGKAFATTISPYLVLPEALAPFRTNGPRQDPPPLPHLAVEEPRNFDIHLEARWETNRQNSRAVHTLTSTNFRHMYWSTAQQIAHLRASGVRLQLGDLHGSGTISGPEPGSEGSLLERGGPYLEDGDKLVFRAWAGEGENCVGWGEMEMTVAPPLG
jgi:fumarylacetoacetase